MGATPTFGRYAELPVDEMTPEQREGYRITSRWHSAYPTAAHEKRGKEVGLPAPLVEAIIAGLPASFSDPREQVVYEVAMAIAGGRLVAQGLYDRAVKALGYAVPAGSPGLTR